MRKKFKPLFHFIGSRLESLYPQIRQKFASALTNWYPSDPSAKVILEPWLKVSALNCFSLSTIRVSTKPLSLPLCALLVVD